MFYNLKNLDEMVLAILYINSMETGSEWKNLPWDSLNRLHDTGLISKPITKAKAVSLSEEAITKAKEFSRKRIPTT